MLFVLDGKWLPARYITLLTYLPASRVWGARGYDDAGRHDRSIDEIETILEIDDLGLDISRAIWTTQTYHRCDGLDGLCSGSVVTFVQIHSFNSFFDICSSVRQDRHSLQYTQQQLATTLIFGARSTDITIITIIITLSSIRSTE